MSVIVAALWVIGFTILFLWLLLLVSSLRSGSELDIVTTFGCQAAAYLLGLFAVLQVHAPRAGIRDFLGIRPTHGAFFPLAVALGLALEAPVGALYHVIERRWPSSGEAEAELARRIAEGGTAERVSLGLILVLLGPLVEEILFRGALVRPMLRRYGRTTVVVTTAALFGIAHFEPQKFLPIAVFGVALGVLRLASGSLLPAVALHATYNAVPFVAMLSAGQPGAAADDAPAPLWLVAASSVAAAGLLALTLAAGARAASAARARQEDRA